MFASVNTSSGGTYCFVNRTRKPDGSVNDCWRKLSKIKCPVHVGSHMKEVCGSGTVEKKIQYETSQYTK